ASFITGNGSCNCSRQYASWAAMSGCDRDCRCQYAKSAYCIESGGGGGGGCPAGEAACRRGRSPAGLPSVQPTPDSRRHADKQKVFPFCQAHQANPQEGAFDEVEGV